MIDCSPVFPDYDRAEAHLEHNNHDRAEVRLYSGGTYATITVNVDSVANFLEQLRREQKG